MRRAARHEHEHGPTKKRLVLLVGYLAEPHSEFMLRGGKVWSGIDRPVGMAALCMLNWASTI
jgi:hypothetical protein